MIDKGLDRRWSWMVFLLLTMMLPARGAFALEVKGVIDSDARWTPADSPVSVLGDIRVASGARLTVDPGVEVVFQPRPDTARGYSIDVEGALAAVGEAGRPIRFTAQNREAPWGAIVFRDVGEDWDETMQTGSILSYCILEYGGNNPDGAAMVVTENAMPRIAGNALRFAKTAGIAAFATQDAVSLSGNLQILNNRIYNNPTGLVLSGEGGRVEGNYFLNNGRAVDIQTRSHAVDLLENTIVGSSGELFGSGIHLELNEPAGGIASYHWVQTGGPEVVLGNPNSARASFTAPDPGLGAAFLSFTLTVTGRIGIPADDSVDITVLGFNEPPVAAAGGDLNVELLEDSAAQVEVTLNGAGSHDPYIGIAEYRWTQTAGPPVSLEPPEGVTTRFAVPASIMPGDRMTFQLTVTDQTGLQSTDTVDVIFYRGNIYPVAEAGENLRTIQGRILSLDGSASRDPDGGVIAYLWRQTGGPAVELFNPSTAKPFFQTPAVDGDGDTLTFELGVLDTGGLQDSDTVSVEVEGATVAVTGDDRTVRAFQPVVLDGTASFDLAAAAEVSIQSNRIQSNNPNAGMVAVTALENAESRLEINGNNIHFTGDPGYAVYLYDWQVDAETLDMTDNWWGTEDPAVIEGLILDQNTDFQLPEVVYRPFAPQPWGSAGSPLVYPPLADAGPDQETGVDRTVTLDGSGSYDPDGIAEYRWRQVDGPGVTLRDADRPVASFVAPRGGSEGETLGFSLTVTTDGAFVHTDEATVAIRPDEPVPVVEAGGGGCFVHTINSERTSTINMDVFVMTGLVCLMFGLGGIPGFSRRRFFCWMLIVAGAVAGFTPLDADAGFFAVGAGGGGDADQYNLTVETGAKDFSAGDLNFMFAVGIPFIPHGDDNLPDDTIADPCPNIDCLDAGAERKGTEVGFYGKLGMEIGSTNLFLNLIGGFTAYTESRLSQSPGSGAFYEDSSDTTVDPLYGAGVSYFFSKDVYWPVLFQVDFDIIRGVTGTIGWHW